MGEVRGVGVHLEVGVSYAGECISEVLSMEAFTMSRSPVDCTVIRSELAS